jgi:hypothetical protein
MDKEPARLFGGYVVGFALFALALVARAVVLGAFGAVMDRWAELDNRVSSLEEQS